MNDSGVPAGVQRPHVLHRLCPVTERGALGHRRRGRSSRRLGGYEEKTVR